MKAQFWHLIWSNKKKKPALSTKFTSIWKALAWHLLLSGNSEQKMSRRPPKLKVRRLNNDYLPTWCFTTARHFPQAVWRLNHVTAVVFNTVGRDDLRESRFHRWLTSLELPLAVRKTIKHEMHFTVECLPHVYILRSFFFKDLWNRSTSPYECLWHSLPKFISRMYVFCFLFLISFGEDGEWVEINFPS